MKSLLFFFLAFVSFTSIADTHGIKYPERAEQLRVTGHAKVLYDIDNDGRVNNIRFIEAEPRYVFEREISKGMKRWQFAQNTPRRDVPHEFTFAAR